MATEEVQYWADELDDEARLAAQREFTNSIGAEVEEMCIRLKEEVAKRYLLICNGDRPKPFGAFDRDEIQRLLAYNLNFTYDGYEIDEFSDFSGSIESCMDEVSKVTDSEEAWSRYELVKAFRKYLETAAAFAKSIGATPAMRLYMRAFLILESLNSDSNLRRRMCVGLRCSRRALRKCWLQITSRPNCRHSKRRHVRLKRNRL